MNNSIQDFSNAFKTAGEQWEALSKTVTEALSQKANADERIKDLQQALADLQQKNADLTNRNEVLMREVEILETDYEALESKNKANEAAAKAFKAISKIVEQVQRDESIDSYQSNPEFEKYRHNPAFQKCNFKLGCEFFKAKDFTNAIRHFHNANKKDWTTWYYLAKANIQRANYSQVDLYFEKAIECDPNQGEIYHLKFQYLRGQGRTSDANTARKKAEELGVKV